MGKINIQTRFSRFLKCALEPSFSRRGFRRVERRMAERRVGCHTDRLRFSAEASRQNLTEGVFLWGVGVAAVFPRVAWIYHCGAPGPEAPLAFGCGITQLRPEGYTGEFIYYDDADDERNVAKFEHEYELYARPFFETYADLGAVREALDVDIACQPFNCGTARQFGGLASIDYLRGDYDRALASIDRAFRLRPNIVGSNEGVHLERLRRFIQQRPVVPELGDCVR